MTEITNTTGTLCLKHKDELATNRCKICRKPICAKCTIKRPEGVFCSPECIDKNAKVQQRWNTIKRKEEEAERVAAPTKLLMSLVKFVSFILVLCLCALLFLNDPNIVAQKIPALAPIMKKIGLLK